jgi:hypothetical protein
MKKLFLFVSSTILWLSLQGASAQQPTSPMVVVQAATTSQPPVAQTTSTPTENSPTVQAAVKALRQAKAANAETLKRQEATLQQLDDLQKAAEQLKIFAKRG